MYVCVCASIDTEFFPPNRKRQVPTQPLLTSAAVARGKDEDRSQSLAPLSHTLDEGARCKLTWSVHRFAVVVGTPGGGVDVDVLIIETQATRLDGISYLAVEHANAANLRIVGYSNGANVVIRNRCNLAGAPSPMTIGIICIVLGHGIRVVVVDVKRGEGILCVCLCVSLV